MYKYTRNHSWAGGTPNLNFLLCLCFLKEWLFTDLWYSCVGRQSLINSHDLRMCCVSDRKDKADPSKITNTQRIDGALPTIKKARHVPRSTRYCHSNGFQNVSMVLKKTNKSLARSWTRAPRQLCWHPTWADPMAA